MFVAGPSGRFNTSGTFGGIGWLYFSVGRKIIDFKGLHAIELPIFGQDADDKYQFIHESFTLQSVIPIGKGEYAFQALNNGPFDRMVTGRIRIQVGPSGVSGRAVQLLSWLKTWLSGPPVT